MIERVNSTAHLSLKPEDVLEVYRSINENMMSAESYPTQKSEATIVGARRAGEIGVFVHYHLYQDDVGLVYRETDPIDQSTYATYRDAALESVESMGFLLENMNFRKLDDDQKQDLFARLPAFGGVGKHVADYDSTQQGAADESVFLLDETVHELASDAAAATSLPPTPTTSIALPEETWNIFMRFIASL